MNDLNETERAIYRGLIEARLHEIEAEDKRGAQGQAVVELDQQAVGRLSRMDALQAQAMSKAQGARRRQEASRLRAALVRLDKGEYGYCEECGDRIPDGRLKLDLAATQCVSCARG